VPESVPGDRSRGRVVDGHGSAAIFCCPVPAITSANEPGYFGKSSYNALQLRADKRFGAGSLVSANYTFSRNYGNVETVTGWLESGAGNPAAGYQTNNLDNEFALSSFDVRHRFVFNYVLDLPFGEGRRFGSGTSGFAGNLISGWTVSGFTTLQAGLPLAFTATPNLIGSGYGLRPNVDPNCNKKVSGSAVDRLNQWFNTSCFSVPNAAFVAGYASTDPSVRWEPWQSNKDRSRPARAWRQQLEPRRLEDDARRQQSEPDAPCRSVQSVQSRAVRPPNTVAHDGGHEYLRPGHDRRRTSRG
jgi:hypothetical protein